MLTRPSFKKSLIVEQFQGNYLKDQDSANIVKTQLKDLSIKLQTTVQPVFVSKKIGQDLKECDQTAAG